MARIWRIEVNIDEMAALLAGLETVEERGRFLDGLMVGSRGFDPNVSWPEAKLMGYHVGRKGYEIAMAYSTEQSDKGKKSAEAKRLRKINHGSTTVEGWLDHGLTTDEPSLNQASTNRSNDLTNTKELPSPSALASSATPPQAERPLVEKKRKSAVQQARELGYPNAVIDFAIKLKSMWPTENPKGTKVTNVMGDLLANLNRVVKENPSIPMDLIQEGVDMYLATTPYTWKSVQHYFGPGGPGESPRWFDWVNAAVTKRQMESANV